ncbi:MAG: hypothetical protein JWL77_2028 [Chthonomonadaceae bacterium]|nr:hypothetical protein [Chthonomonadaceae bacterium]
MLILDTYHGDRADLRFLKGLNMEGMVIRRFADIDTKYVPSSNERTGGMMTYQDKATGDKATKYSIGSIRWVSDNEVEVHWFKTSYPHFGMGGTYQVIRTKGKWIVKQITPDSLYRA